MVGQSFLQQADVYIYIQYIVCDPLPITVTTRIMTCLVGNVYKHAFATGILRGHNQNVYTCKSTSIKKLTGTLPTDR